MTALQSPQNLDDRDAVLKILPKQPIIKSIGNEVATIYRLKLSIGREVMNFSGQIKKIRTDNNLTQEQMSEKLNVSRQTISSWETGRNLPDLEMVVRIAEIFGLSLDELILGGDGMAEKLIKDGSETRKAKFNTVTVTVGAMLLIIGVLCFVIKTLSFEYVDSTGLLHENFFLISIGFMFLFSGIITFSVVGIRNVAEKIKNRKK